MLKKEKKTEKKISGSLFAKMIAFFVLAISTITGLVTAFCSIVLYEWNAYNYQNQNNCVEVVARELMVDYAWDEMHVLRDNYSYYPENTEQLEELYKDKNFTVEIYEGDDLLWGNYTGYETPYSYRYTYSQYVEVPVEQENTVQNTTQNTIQNMTQNKTQIEVKEPADTETDDTEVYDTEELVTESELKEFTCWLYVNPEFSIDDEYRMAYNRAVILSEGRYVYPIVAVGCVLIALISFIFLMCSAGHKNGKEGITPTVLNAMHFDVITVGFVVVAYLGLLLMLSLMDYGFGFEDLVQNICMILLGCVEVVWGTIYCMELATRLKMGTLWRHTVIATVIRFVGKIIRLAWSGIVALVKGLPLVWNVAFLYVAISIAEFVGLCLWGDSTELIVIWILEKIVLFAVVMYIALICKKLQAGSEALAEGDLNFKLDTSKMVLDFKEHGENLNQIGEGIAKAVDARMKSEHLKTELITNVSHDLKTPLTSIINYADLLGYEVMKEENGEAAENRKIAEYAEVLLRQSKRLKKLLEDLVEASKATTGALEVNLEPCEIGVLLSQAVGEYEQRFAEKQLNLIVRQPEEPVKILADGRHLWRVFDNLLNNICKYAQENTRVYLSVENKENQVEIIFRNMSKYALDISAEELEERFVRGDKSRHMEGNGLGLSIAKSLVELQNGQMQIVTDGDLFKVTLYFKSI